MTRSILTTYESNFKLNIRDVMDIAEEIGFELSSETSAKLIRKLKKEKKEKLDETYWTTLKDIVKSYIVGMKK